MGNAVPITKQRVCEANSCAWVARIATSAAYNPVRSPEGIYVIGDTVS